MHQFTKFMHLFLCRCTKTHPFTVLTASAWTVFPIVKTAEISQQICRLICSSAMMTDATFERCMVTPSIEDFAVLLSWPFFGSGSCVAGRSEALVLFRIFGAFRFLEDRHANAQACRGCLQNQWLSVACLGEEICWILCRHGAHAR